MESGICLFCDKTDLSSSSQADPLSEQPFKNKPILQNKLSSVFVLEQLLKIPSELLMQCGDNPNSWVVACEDCHKVVTKAQEAFWEIRKACRKLQVCRNEVVEKIKTCIKAQSEMKATDSKTQAVAMIRDFVKSNVYPVEIKVEYREIVTSTADVIELPVPEFVEEPPESPESPPSPPPKKKKTARPSSPTPLPVSTEVLMDLLLNKHKCPQCKFIGSIAKLANHLKAIHPQDPDDFQCDLCDQTYDSKERLRRHRYNTHTRKEQLKKKLVKCPHCEYTCPRKFGITKHILRMHESTQDWNCELCPKKFILWEKLRYHQAVQHFKCSLKTCKLVCKSQADLREHQVNVHGQEVDAFLCQICGKWRSKRYEMKMHMDRKHKDHSEIQESNSKEMEGESSPKEIKEESNQPEEESEILWNKVMDFL